MSDNLRDRIADVLADEFKRQGYACEWAVLADAVIEALGLKHYNDLREVPSGKGALVYGRPCHCPDGELDGDR